MAVCLYLFRSRPTLPRPELHRWQGMEWIPARSHQTHCIIGSGSFLPAAPPYMFSERPGGRQSLHPPHPPQPNAHVLGPPCQASAPGLITGPAGMAPISWICYNHLRSSHSHWEQSECPSALQARPLNLTRVHLVLLDTFPLSDLLITGLLSNKLEYLTH